MEWKKQGNSKDEMIHFIPIVKVQAVDEEEQQNTLERVVTIKG